MRKTALAPANRTKAAAPKVAEAILDFLADVPDTTQTESRAPQSSAKRIARRSSRRAAMAAGTLALPPGPLGWLTILPELIAVWKIQAQMVADIAGIYGKSASLNREQMIYCLFRHTAAQALRDVVVRVGERYLVKHASLRVMQAVARQVGISVTQRSLSKLVGRWVPVVGAMGVAGYAYYDTGKVAETAIELFQSGMDVQAPAVTRDLPKLG